MEDRKLTEAEAYALNRGEQMAILYLRDVDVQSGLNEPGLVKLIMDTNNKVENNSSQIKPGSFSGLSEPELIHFKKILEIARAGFPNDDVVKLIEKLQKELK